MSNSLLPKKAPNVFNQETLERALVVLRQPFSIAVLASLAAHGLLWAALPNMFTQQKEPETQRRVKVVELSPAEQGQLPQLGINPLPQTLVPVKPLSPAQSGTKLPDPKFANDPLLDTLPIFQLPPPSLSLPDFSKLLSPNVTEPKKEPKKQTTTISREKIPPPPSDLETLKKDPGATRGKDETPARSTTLSPEQIAASQKKAERSRQLRALYAFNGPDTKEKAAGVFSANATAFIDAANKVTGRVADDSRLYNKPERVDGVFPKDACPFVGSVRNASFGAVMKPDGSLAETPTILLTSGFEGLDNAAIDDIISLSKNKKFGESDKFQLIRFDYIFDPKAVCPNVSKPA